MPVKCNQRHRICSLMDLRVQRALDMMPRASVVSGHMWRSAHKRTILAEMMILLYAGFNFECMTHEASSLCPLVS